MSSYKSYADSELLSLLCGNDHAAFTEIFHRYKGMLYLHAFRLLGDREEAREIVQELFTTLWTRRADLKITGCLSAYLYTSIRNRVIKLISHKQVESAHFTSLGRFIHEGNPIADHLVREKELTRIIEKEISKLPPKMQVIFNLSRKEYLSHREIAERMNLSSATVKKQVNNALKILRVKLEHFLFLFF